MKRDFDAVELDLILEALEMLEVDYAEQREDDDTAERINRLMLEMMGRNPDENHYALRRRWEQDRAERNALLAEHRRNELTKGA